VPRREQRIRDMAAGSALTLTGVGLARAARSRPVRFARMAGSSIAAPDAAGWVTDFLNAAYFRRPQSLRELDDLRLAFSIVTTRWHRGGYRRLRGHDMVAFHRAFGRRRFLERVEAPRGTLSRRQLLDGACNLLGDWFPDAYADIERRGWGIAFETAEEKAAYRPEERQRAAALREPTPPAAPVAEQVWHTYPPVSAPAADHVLGALARVERWPDYASETGRFTPVRGGGLADQTFEIEVVAHPMPRTPLYTRGYVTVTRLLTTGDGAELGAYVAEINHALERFGHDEPPAVPHGARPVAVIDLTTHEGHFMGRALNRLLLYEHERGTWLRACGTWDPMPWHLSAAYRRLGQQAQQAFWGMGTPRESMLHQIARAAA
jgi:hypothetical protein